MTQNIADVIGTYADWGGAMAQAAKLSVTEFAVAKDAALQAGWIEQDDHDGEFYATEEGVAAVFAAMDRGEVAL